MDGRKSFAGSGGLFGAPLSRRSALKRMGAGGLGALAASAGLAGLARSADATTTIVSWASAGQRWEFPEKGVLPLFKKKFPEYRRSDFRRADRRHAGEDRCRYGVEVRSLRCDLRRLQLFAAIHRGRGAREPRALSRQGSGIQERYPCRYSRERPRPLSRQTSCPGRQALRTAARQQLPDAILPRGRLREGRV